MLKSRTIYPPGGWTFFQPQTGKSFEGMTFLQTVDAIIQHRHANPRFNLSQDMDAVSRELDEFTCARIKHDKNYCVDANAANFSSPLLPRQSAGVSGAGAVAVRAGEFFKNIKVGIRTYIDFFGDGKPETVEVAEARAAICRTCPHNTRGGLLDFFTQSAANEIMSIMGVLKDLNLHTAHEDELHVCSVCSCPLKAKQFAPLPIILKHMPPETVAKLPAFCWIKKGKQ